ncbi:MAG: acyltransferase family protein [Bacteroidales bacterium]|nr:acyltransferase family protein [Bacteroidales bacterium]
MIVVTEKMVSGGASRVKERQSGMELLRIIAMFLVLVVHAGFFSLGSPSFEDVHTNSLSSFTRIFFQSLSIGCVDMFVLLSGWFGIRPKKKGFLSFVYQCAFFLFGIYAVCLVFGLSPLNKKGIAGCLLLLNWNWFIKAYLLLYILSPVLNAFIDSSTEKQHRMVLIAFFLFQTFYSWFSDAAIFFEKGYSTISFIGLYMLARYASKYKERVLTWKRCWYLCFFIVSVLLLALLYYLASYYRVDILRTRMLRYDNPLVILSAFSFVVYFSKLSFKSTIVNWIAASSFAVFLLHTNPNLCKTYFTPAIRYLFKTFSGVECLLFIFLFLTAIYLLAIVLDQIRKLTWNCLCKLCDI